MKQTAMHRHIPFLPGDIIASILKRLPVKSLIKFQCVCKDWKNLLKTPSFIGSHLHHSHNQNPFLLFTRFDRNHKMLFDLLNCKMQQRLEVGNAPEVDWIWSSIIGFCNGLLCFSIEFSCISPPSFLLWNPATRQVRKVPRPLTNFDGAFFVGFGFNPIVNDYKIVVNYGDPFSHEVSRVAAYSLNTGSWKEIEFGNLNGVSFKYETQYVNGVIYWLATKQVVSGEDGDDDTPMIVSFNIATEVFTLIHVPVSASPRLTAYENKLALLFSTVSYKSSFIDLWVMEKETGPSRGSWTWTKKYTSDTHPCFLSPLTIWKSQIVCTVVELEIIAGSDDDDESTCLYLFNLTTNELKMFPTGRFFGDDAIFTYSESLAPLDNIYAEVP